MGPFSFIPFMQCRHSVYSMRHCVNGNVSINGVTYSFQNAVGYIEGDRGRSFPRDYVWTQASFPDGALMLSIAEIPFGTLRFTGVIGIVLLQGKEYRIATYLGAKAVKISSEEIIVRQGKDTFIIKPQDFSGYPLHAPVSGAMKRTIISIRPAGFLTALKRVALHYWNWTHTMLLLNMNIEGEQLFSLMFFTDSVYFPNILI